MLGHINIWYIASSRGPLPKLFKLCLWGQNWPRPGRHNFTLNYIRKSSNNIFSWTANGNFTKLHRNDPSSRGPLLKLFKLCPWGSLLLAPLWPLTFSSGERPRALWALLFNFFFGYVYAIKEHLFGPDVDYLSLFFTVTVNDVQDLHNGMCWCLHTPCRVKPADNRRCRAGSRCSAVAWHLSGQTPGRTDSRPDGAISACQHVVLDRSISPCQHVWPDCPISACQHKSARVKNGTW